MTRRLVTGLLTATLIAGALIGAPIRTSWSPICATFSEGSIDWYLFFCFIDPPPKDPNG
jgi:hypothetical protein